MKFFPKKIPLKKFRQIYSTVPRITVELIIKGKDGIVLSKREIEPCVGQWHYPGGTILYGESMADTIARVAEEETGLKVKIEKMMGIIEYPPDIAVGHVFGVVHLVRPISGVLRGSNQGKEIRYFKSLPKNTIKEHARFWRKNKLTYYATRSLSAR